MDIRDRARHATPRFDHGAGLVNDKICAIGGGIFWPPDPLSTVEEYDPLVTSVEDKVATSPRYFVLHQNYPNPFRNNSTVRLEIYNTRGQKIRTIVNDKQRAGAYSIQLDSKDDNELRVSSGIYIYKVSMGNLVEAKRIVMLK